MSRTTIILAGLTILTLAERTANAQQTVSFTTPTEISIMAPAIFGAEMHRMVIVQNQPGLQFEATGWYGLVGVTPMPMPNGNPYYTMYIYAHTREYTVGSGTRQYNVFRVTGGTPQFPNKTFFRTFNYTP